MQINRCPNCGWSPSEITHYRAADKRFIYEVECSDCGLHTGRCDTREEAVEKWNEITKGENDETTKA
jgi:hypothetical protein